MRMIGYKKNNKIRIRRGAAIAIAITTAIANATGIKTEIEIETETDIGITALIDIIQDLEKDQIEPASRVETMMATDTRGRDILSMAMTETINVDTEGRRDNQGNQWK